MKTAERETLMENFSSNISHIRSFLNSTNLRQLSLVACIHLLIHSLSAYYVTDVGTSETVVKKVEGQILAL